MRSLIKTKAFSDPECTCECGNKHELYNGKGYTTETCEGYSDGNIDGGYFYHSVRCNQCNALHELAI
jgi:hypothetical protein